MLYTHAVLMEDLEKNPGVFRNKTLSGNELMEKLALSHKGTFRKNYLNPALKEGLVVRTLPDKPNSRNQKYKRR